MKDLKNSLVEGMERLGLIASRIRKNEGSTPKIEIDIIMEELRNLYMVALQLEAENALATDSGGDGDMKEESEQKAAEEEQERIAKEAAARKAAEEKRQAEEAAARKAAEEKRQAEEAAARKAAEEKRQAEEAAARKAAEEKARRIVDEEFRPKFAPATQEPEAEPVKGSQMERIEGNPNDELFAEPSENKHQEPSLLDLFKVDKEKEQPQVRTLADTLGKSQRTVEDRLETRVNAKKVDDLRTIININDKFSFMSELFHSNMKAYNDFILRLNAFESREEALAYVSEIAAQYNWDFNSVVVKGFYKVFDKKF